MTPSSRRRPARRPVRVALALSLVCASGAAAHAQAPRLTVARLKALPATSNDPRGDAFTGTPQALGALLDAMAADSSLVGPMQLLLASNTALRLGRVEDAGFFLYAAQVRAAIGFERYDAPRRADGNNAATYLGFLNQTIGEQVNPAIMVRLGNSFAMKSSMRRISSTVPTCRFRRSSATFTATPSAGRSLKIKPSSSVVMKAARGAK